MKKNDIDLISVILQIGRLPPITKV